MKISEIKSIIETMDPRQAFLYLDSLENNEIVQKVRDKVNIEFNRLKKMQKFENQVFSHGLYNPAGLDEAGRGPLAGPVVAAAVILPKDYLVYGLNDSKKVSEKRRNVLNSIIRRDALDFAVSAIDHFRIDKTNILLASKEAMLNCVNDLKKKPGYLLVDAVHIDGTDIRQAGIIRGDGRSVSIAAASILAKVYRDSLMYEYDRIYPEYGFCRNKGYGTKEHIAALKKHGPCKIHRSSFIKNIV
ncbi:MAG: ribonuclease HII [Clostridiales bacterium]|nr:ribonuclease HII [Clostridiales bacterium]